MSAARASRRTEWRKPRWARNWDAAGCGTRADRQSAAAAAARAGSAAALPPVVASHHRQYGRCEVTNYLSRASPLETF